MVKGSQHQTLLDCSLEFNWRGTCGEELTAVEAAARLSDEKLELMPRFGDALSFPLRQISDVSEGEHRVVLSIEGGESVELYHLGYKYSDFHRILNRQRNELMLADLLMYESVRRAGIGADCTYITSAGKSELGNCELRLCDTALLVLPDSGEPRRFPYSFIERVEEHDYKVSLFIETGEVLKLSRLGRDYDSFIQLLSQLLNELSLKAQELLRELAPNASPAVIRGAARLMREGRVARRCDLDEVSPDLWGNLERRLDLVGIRDEYSFLLQYANRQQVGIGFKRQLQAEGEYVWFLLPLVDSNALAMEASSGPDSGRATYFFRIASRPRSGIVQW
ncbi:MAG: hypothetical protein FH749_13305 [Firmicutes bacterium]|nr:hypothetical protein [Bacillota bacterium]